MVEQRAVLADEPEFESKQIAPRHPGLKRVCIRFVPHLVGGLLYLSLAVASTWPVAQSLAERLSLGTEATRTVPLFNAWTLWWNADRLAAGGQEYWDSPIFFPSRNTFALSEPQPFSLVVAPIFWATGSIVLAYNLYLWLALILNGWMTQWCLRWIGLRWSVAVGGGAAMVLLPVVHWQLGVIQLVPLWGIIWTWWALAKMLAAMDHWDADRSESASRFRRSRVVVWRGAELGMAFGVSFLMCVHHALFLALLMMGTSWMLGRRWLQPSVWLGMGSAVLTSGLLIAPVLVPLRQMASTEEYVRPREIVQQLSLVPSDYLAAYGKSFVEWPDGLARGGWWMSPGGLRWLLAFVGTSVGFFVRRKGPVSIRWWTGYLLSLGVLAWLLSLGANLRVGAWEPWWLVAEYVPGFAQVRNVFRFGYFVQIVVVLLAAQGIDGALGGLAGRGLTTRTGWKKIGSATRSSHGLRWFCAAVLGLLGIWSVFDPWPHRQRLGVVPAVSEHRVWMDHLREHRQPGEGALCLPMAGGQDVRDYETEADWMILAIDHGVPLANGYSGFLPPSYYDLQWAVLQSGVNIPTAAKLYADGVRWIVMDRRRFQSPWGDLWILGELQAQREIGNGSGVDLYRLLPFPPPG